MTRYIQLVLLSLALVGSSIACAPKLGGPTVPSGYVFSYRASDPAIWLGHIWDRQMLPTSYVVVKHGLSFGATCESVRIADGTGNPRTLRDLRELE